MVRSVWLSIRALGQMVRVRGLGRLISLSDISISIPESRIFILILANQVSRNLPMTCFA